MNSYIFDSITVAFYPVILKDDYVAANMWPPAGVEVDEEVFASFREQPIGKQLGANSEGYPCWIDSPPPPKDVLVAQSDSKKAQLAASAEQSIRPLERAKQLGIATDGELYALTEWERYSVFLMRVDTSKAPDIVWPTLPTV